ncbi:virulence factor TspB C-terminal domain-related protein [Kingella oralis]|jgi:hypothetical protein|nr:virulence factor TspB C-terminal domain-related protein [Kingella oralis]QMT43112.1 hypothetical protein H3L93_01795 [Kingella oralis]
MKQLITLIALSFSILAINARAENIVQFTGGNYIYAENGRLTFNLNPSVIKNRNWQYNAQTDLFRTTFTTKRLDFKTKHASDFYAYENAAFNSSPSFNPYYAGNYVYPVYRPNQQQFTAQPVFLPALAGIVVRVGAIVLRNVIPPLVTKCITNARCAATVGGTVIGGGVPICMLNYAGLMNALPSGICSQAEQAGFEKDKDGKYKRKVKYHAYSHGDNLNKANVISKYFVTESQAIEAAERACKAAAPNAYSSYKPEFESFEKSQNSKDDLIVFDCKWSFEDLGTKKRSVGGFQYIIKKISEKEEELTIVDISNFAAEDSKKNPNDYINHPVIGKDILATAKPDEADFQWQAGSGFSVISSPYRDNNGETKQDVVNIGAPKPEPNPKAGGNAGNPTAGVSNVYNNVTVKNLPRPDKEDDSKPSENNSPNGNNSPLGSNNGSDDDKKGNGGNCEEHPNSVGCVPMGDIEDNGSNPFGDAIGKHEDKTTYSPDNFLPGDGSCPPPKQMVLMGRTYDFSYDLFCRYSGMIRALVIAVAFMTAGFIIFGKKNA